MARVLFFTSEPGGAEVLSPLVPITREAGHETVVAAYGHGAVRLRENGVTFRTADPVRADRCRLLEEVRPDFLITSATSLPERDMSERHLWLHARGMGIGSLAFIDQWQNYGIRFRGPDAGSGFAFLPDHINCIDAIGRAEMLAEGLPEERMVAFGLPHLAPLASLCLEVDPASLLKKLGIPHGWERKEQTLLYVSEPLAEHYGSSRGYDQYLVLELFLEAVRLRCPRVRVLVKLHPKDDRDKFRALEKRFAELPVAFIQDEISHIECLCLADRVFGMTSVMLVEAYLLGKVVVSLQPGLKGTDHLVLSRLGLVPRIDDLRRIDPLGIGCAGGAGLAVDFDRTAYLEFLKRRIDEVTRMNKGAHGDS